MLEHQPKPGCPGQATLAHLRYYNLSCFQSCAKPQTLSNPQHGGYILSPVRYSIAMQCMFTGCSEGLLIICCSSGGGSLVTPC